MRETRGTRRRGCRLTTHTFIVGRGIDVALSQVSKNHETSGTQRHEGFPSLL